MEGFYHTLEQTGRDSEERTCKITVKISMTLGFIENVRFFVWGIVNREIAIPFVGKNGEYACFEGEVILPIYNLYRYCFKFYAEYQEKTTELYKLAVGFPDISWSDGAVMCQIHPDRFAKAGKEALIPMGTRSIHGDWNEEPLVGPDANGNWCSDFYGGNLKGIEEHLPYLKRLGVDIIYLMPLSMSSTNHHYDSGDMYQMDPYLGTWDDLERLCNSAHKKGMHVIVDVVYNHVGRDSKYFNALGTYDSVGASQGERSPYFPWFETYKDGNGEIQFRHWWGVTDLVVCDKNNKEWQEYVYGKGGHIDRLFACGIDGLRIDVADELPDFFLEEINKAVVRNKPDGLILGEVWVNGLKNPFGKTYLSSGKSLHTQMDYFFCSALMDYIKYGDVDPLRIASDQILYDFPDEVVHKLMNFSSTHDMARAINNFSSAPGFKRNGEWSWSLEDESAEWQRSQVLTREQYKYGKEVEKLYLFILAFWPGILSVFYGDEVGIQGAGNVANRKSYPWGRRDKDLLKYVKYIIHIRKKNQFLRSADTKVLSITPELFVFERKSDTDQVLVVANRSEYEQDITHYAATKEVIAAYRYKADSCVLRAHGAVALV